jgi:hypothetical protein
VNEPALVEEAANKNAAHAQEKTRLGGEWDQGELTRFPVSEFRWLC